MPSSRSARCVVLPYGRCAWLVESDADRAVLRGLRQRFVDAIRADVRTADALDVVPAACTVLVRWADEARAAAAEDAVHEIADGAVARAGGSAAPDGRPAEDDLAGAGAGAGAAQPDGEPARGMAEGTPFDADGQGADHADGELVIPVTYDGEDLTDVAAQLGCTPEEVVRRHQAARWVVEFAGFAPGFAYLTQIGDPQELSVTRRATPRTSIPAGAVALAGDYAGVSPSASPGGWQLIGRTDLRMFDQARRPAALLTPGRRVRFVDAEHHGPRGDDASESTATTVDGREHTGRQGNSLSNDEGEARDDHTSRASVTAATPRPGPDVVSQTSDASPRRAPDAGTSGLVVEKAGPQVLIEDLGRPGHLDVGLTVSGACDRSALRLANRLVGNDEDAAALEVVFGGLALRAEQPCIVAVTGAPVGLTIERSRVSRESGATPTHPTAAGQDAVLTQAPMQPSAPRGETATRHPVRRAANFATPILLEPGDRLTLGMPFDGLRSYVAVAGGIDAVRVEGSASSDPRNGIGTPTLRAGARLAIGPARSAQQPGYPDHLAPASVLPPGPLVLRATWGPRADWFTLAAREAFASSSYLVTQDADRVGIRFDGPSLTRAMDGELASEAVIRGAVQVPADGRPLMFFADHPTTGGYPVIAVVDDADTDLLAQARPGQEVRFAVSSVPSQGARVTPSDVGNAPM